MAKKKSIIYGCTECGGRFKKWSMVCPDCSSADSLEITNEDEQITTSNQVQEIQSLKLDSYVEVKEIKHHKLKNDKFNLLFSNEIKEEGEVGTGIVDGSIILLTGAPGSGKSTFLLYLLKQLQVKNKTIYFSGEENERQVKSRADRLNIGDELYGTKFTNSLEHILGICKGERPDMIVIDSIQKIETDSVSGQMGGVSQVKACIALLTKYCKEQGITCFIVGQVTKGGDLGGPRALEHEVDTVLYLELENFDGEKIRMLKPIKNRFGNCDNVVPMIMESDGYKVVDDERIAKLFIKDRNIQDSDYGYCLSAIQEGNQTYMMEVQCSLSKTITSFPIRQVSGYSKDRLLMLTSVIEKFGIYLGSNDIMLNIVGKKWNKTGELDVAVIVSILSAYKKKRLDKPFGYGEVGLRGEVAGNNLEKINNFIKKGTFGISFTKDSHEHFYKILKEF